MSEGRDWDLSWERLLLGALVTFMLLFSSYNFCPFVCLIYIRSYYRSPHFTPQWMYMLQSAEKVLPGWYRSTWRIFRIDWLSTTSDYCLYIGHSNTDDASLRIKIKIIGNR